MKLYELSQAYRDVEESLASADEEMPDGIELLKQIEHQLDDKLLACARVVKNMTSEAEAIKAEEHRLYQRRKALDSSAARLREYMQHEMQHAGLEKTKDAQFTVALQNNPPSVRLIDAKKVPVTYWIPQDAVLDKRRILDDLKAGGSVDGVEIEQGKSLRIR